MIETSRLIIRPLSCHELKMLAESFRKLPEKQDFGGAQHSIDEDFREIIEKDILPEIIECEGVQLFQTIWFIVEKSQETVVGEFRFHGNPDKNGAVEIGYRIDQKHQGRGYMTEAIDGIIRWIEKRQEITSVLAETSQTNIASQMVLSKNNFKIQHESGDLIIFKADIF